MLQLAFVTCSIAVGSAPEVRMKMVGMRAVVSGSTPFRVQGCPCVKAAPRLSRMYLWHPTNNLSSLKTYDSMDISFTYQTNDQIADGSCECLAKTI